MTIDTDKYEGHTEGPWKWDNEGVLQGGPHMVMWVNFLGVSQEYHVSEVDEELIADAPLLLAEVKRLQKQVLALLDENQRLEAMYHMDVHGDDTLAKLLERKK